MVAGRLEPTRLIFVDEMGANILRFVHCTAGPEVTNECPWRCHATAGRTHDADLEHKPREGMGACLAVEGSINAAAFEAYVERVLTSALEPGQVVVMDNLSLPIRARGLKGLIEGCGCELV
jgi:hypothetical protein